MPSEDELANIPYPAEDGFHLRYAPFARTAD